MFTADLKKKKKFIAKNRNAIDFIASIPKLQNITHLHVQNNVYDECFLQVRTVT